MITESLKQVIRRIVTADTDLTQGEKDIILSKFITEHPLSYPDEALITGKAAAEMLKVVPATICNLAKSGRITAISRSQRKVFYIRAEIERMLAGLPAKARF